jgi:hypothetical protein
MPKPDLVAEHAALTKEQAELRQLCVAEWGTMSAQVARQRNARLFYIADRLATIERSKTWRGRNE